MSASGSVSSSLLTETDIPSRISRGKAGIHNVPLSQDEVHAQSLSDPQSFWAKQASYLHWHKPPTRILAEKTKTLRSGAEHKDWEWFGDGEISTCYNCVDRHVLAGNGGETAIIWDSPVTGCKDKISYTELLREVEVFAGVLREEGVKRGDVVLVYMPMIPAALIASCGIDGAKPPLSYRPFVTEAIALSSHKPRKTIIWQREQLRWENLNAENGERNWQRLLKSAGSRGVKAECVPVKSTDGLYIIYTSGTTGLPKGVLREAGGNAVGLNLSIGYVFGIHGPGDVIFCASDIGWVVGHSYILYAPLLAGATTVLFEGKPVGTPNAGTFWRIVDEYKVNTVFTAPTALRAIRRDDSENKLFKEVGERGGLKTLRALFLAGERSEPSIITMYQELLAKYAAKGATVIDHWWSSESGSPMTGIALSPHSALSRTAHRTGPIIPAKPGSAGKPLPGFDVRIVDDSGNEVPCDTMGNIVLGIPLAPTGFRTLWEDEERFYKGYMKRPIDLAQAQLNKQFQHIPLEKYDPEDEEWEDAKEGIERVVGEWISWVVERKVNLPATIEDEGVVEVARGKGGRTPLVNDAPRDLAHRRAQPIGDRETLDAFDAGTLLEASAAVVRTLEGGFGAEDENARRGARERDAG
ncbi:hypothetical protein EYC84_005887 [Monilinia fructicola]|uniref:AMP-dependent synthetase/ligase domain-containing protein n=1 Tax=Monilinia fructicola TaxID=38448 RepID=A0A5M9JXY6_MONFR|nr:hypothetical protein EYC84_005887 [Monilinia fructicola]